MHKGKEFDFLGRHRSPSSEQQLAEVRNRLQQHLRNCKPCLQHIAGFRAAYCPVTKQIQGQERVVLEAMKRKKEGTM